MTSPLILDIRGDGIDLSGHTKIRLATGEIQDLGWTKPNTDDAFLVLDASSARAAGLEVRDKDGSPVKGITFPGDGFRVRGPDNREITTTDGWQMLGAFDANGDGRINSNDPVWQHLKLFTDANADGTIGSGELTSLSESEVAEVRSSNLSSPRVDQSGNKLVDGSFTRRDGTSGVISGVTFGGK